MSTPGRGWDHGERFRPAREMDIRYGHGLVSKLSPGWAKSLVVTSPTAWRTASRYFAAEPKAVTMVSSLDWNDLHRQGDALPDSGDHVIGVGGGKVLDAAKFFALKKDLPLVLVPSAVSTGAIFHGIFARFDGKKSIPGGAQAWPYCDPEYAIVDYDLVLEAPERLNTAGLGDVFCAFGSVSEWRYAARKGLAPTEYEAAIAPTLKFHSRVAEDFIKSFSKGRLTDRSIHVITEAIRDRDDLLVRSEHAPGADHAMFNLVEPNVARSTLIHGELTALVAVIVSWAAGQHRELVERLEKCRVMFRPAAVGITRAELRWILEETPAYLKGRGMNSVLVREPIVSERFDAIWSVLGEGN